MPQPLTRDRFLVNPEDGLEGEYKQVWFKRGRQLQEREGGELEKSTVEVGLIGLSVMGGLLFRPRCWRGGKDIFPPCRASPSCRAVLL